ncbi:MFS transporter [Gorillibacterium timonense]|uniref:MFS transporter n=1 Tax=Gorillibacterium timonense TaxID=1689269 RepID=UPI00071E055B|nr:MFS transporter [Gorillibacterium timonense]
MNIHAEQDNRSSLLEERKSFRRIWITAWMVTAVFVLSNSATPLYVYWQQKFNFSNGTLTLIFASYIVGLLLTPMIAGQLSDRFGRKPVLFPGITAAIIACLLFATAPSVIALLTARFLSGVAVGVMVSAGMASVVDAGGAKLKQQASLAASISMVLGAGLGPLLSSILSSVMTQPVSAFTRRPFR